MGDRFAPRLCPPLIRGLKTKAPRAEPEPSRGTKPPESTSQLPHVNTQTEKCICRRHPNANAVVAVSSSDATDRHTDAVGAWLWVIRSDLLGIGSHESSDGPGAFLVLDFNLSPLTSSQTDWVKYHHLVETLLKPNSPKSCTLAGYVQLRTDRTDAPLGGTAVYYKRSLQCCPIDLPTLSNIEATGCRLAMTGHRTLVIVSIYLSPSKKLLRSDIEALLALGDALNYRENKIRYRRASHSDALSRRLSIAALHNRYRYYKEIALNVDCIEPIYRLVSDHRPVLLRLGPPAGGWPKPMIKSQTGKEYRPRLKSILPHNNIPDVIETTDEIDSSIGLSPTTSGRWSRSAREVPASVDRRKLPADAFELLRAKNAALRLAYAYPSRENRSRARSPTSLTKALKSEGYLPTPPLKKPDSSLAVDDQEKAECIADSIELQCSHTLPPHDTQHISLIEEENSYFSRLEGSRGNRYPKAWKPRNLPASYRPISLLSGLGKVYEKILKTRLSEYLFGKGLIINEQFGFRPNHSCPQQALRLVEYITEGFKTKKRTVAVFFDVAKAFDRTRKHTLVQKNDKAGVPQGSALSPLLYSVYTNDIPRSSSGVQLALFADDTALYLRGQTERNICPHLQKAIEELARWFQTWRIEDGADIRVSVFAHAALKGLKLQVLQNKFCRTATNAHWSSPALRTTLGLDKKNGPNPCWCSSDCQCQGDLLSPHKASHAPPTPPRVARPHTVKLNRIPANSIADPITFCQGNFLVGFSPTLPTRTGARVCSPLRLLVRVSVLCVLVVLSSCRPRLVEGGEEVQGSEEHPNLTRKEEAQEEGELRHLHLQGAQAGPSGHRYI
ncbi:Probable RNA-directed DNA polymerase from transposon X-element [Eumeta japonica]|uniref:Probable RNA-directed DNA polymerase from transposon X-element n=1 Tax=Eumeta variegata TaxID=151549 RepID=A0A4C2AAK1_EUMVA|nr:Probable RNA-directed DNA polymerase from transposon X-element [Eumeta japonica]